MFARLLLILLASLALAMPAAAQTQPSPALRGGADKVVALLRGEAEPAEIFTPAFLAQVPEAQVRSITQQLAAQYGAPRRVATIEAQSETMGVIHIETERATLHMNLVVEPGAPHSISGLLLTGADLRGDSMAAVAAELRQLPGEVSFATARLGDGAPAIAGHETGRPGAIGSTHKLWILAELSRQVRAGQRRWSDVVPLNRRSFAGGTLSAWPQGAPVTLHTLASLMISISDNTATDILLHTLGRESVERMMGTIGIADAARNRPFISTLELAAIKTGPAARLNLWRAADEAGRRALLASDYAAVGAAGIDVSRFSGNPLHLDIEWYATPADLVRTMDWLRRNGDETALAILAISAGLPPGQRDSFAYVGFKGGSEPGVINLTWLVRDTAGGWHAVTGSWNNPQAPVDEARFAGLMGRMVNLLRQGSR